MSVTDDDIRAAVASGLISEAQAASLITLSEARAGARSAVVPGEEPFELFRGFNEIFIVVGLVILYLGWVAVTGFTTMSLGGVSKSSDLILSGIAIAALSACAVYFTIRRRMVAPSIALTVMFTISALQLGSAVAWQIGFNWTERISFAFGTATLGLVLWYFAFRIPFSVALVALGAFTTVGSLFVLQGAEFPSLDDLFLLTNDGPFAWITIVMGLIGFTVAMLFDMSDPHRVSRRSKSGLWLHIIAAPAIVNTVALTLFETGTTVAFGWLFAFLCAIALLSVVIDRRSFLVAGVGYIVALAFVVVPDAAGLATLLLGAALIALGAKWEALRGGIMRGLPEFPGKDRLPPFGLIES